MAVTVAVVNGALPATGTADFTRSGFGTPDCAIIYFTAASSGTNPQAAVSDLSIGFWNASAQNVASLRSQDAVATSNTAQATDDAAVGVIIVYNADTVEATWTAASTTDGLRITLASGTGGAYQATVVMFKGVKSHQVGVASFNGTTPVVVSTGFKPTAIFTACTARTADGVSVGARLSLGIAHNSSADVLTQRCVAHESVDAQATAQIVNTSINEGSIFRTYFNDGAGNVTGAVQDLTASDFEFVASAALTFRIHYLAIELNDPDEFHLSTQNAATATGDGSAITVGFQALACGTLTTRETSVGGTSTSPTGSLSIGVMDSSPQGRSHIYSDEDAAATSDTSTRYVDSKILSIYDHTPAIDAEASVATWGATSLTFNWSDAASSAWKYILWAIGSDAAAGYTHPTLSLATATEIGATSFKPRVTYTFA